ncbi:MAG: NADase-type glycan-binding domain-containing protein [Ilumatobacteraceae bacterium]
MPGAGGPPPASALGAPPAGPPSAAPTGAPPVATAGPGSSEARQIAAALVAKAPPPSTPGSGPALPTRTPPPSAPPPAAAGPPPDAPSTEVMAGLVAEQQQPAPVQPQAVQPQAPQKKKPPKVQPGKPTRTPQKGDLICGECGEANSPGRKFCSRCGTSLAAAVVVKIPWWKRVLRRKPKSAMAGERPWTAKEGGKKKPKRRGLARIIGPVRRVGSIVLVVLGLVYGVYSPFRHWVNREFTTAKDKVWSVIHPQFDSVLAGPGTTSNEAVPLDPNHPAAMAVDDARNTYWLTSPPTDAFRPELDVTLNEKVNLAKIIVTNGAAENFQAHHRAKTLLFIFESGSYEVQLKDTPEPQTITIHNGNGVQHFKIAVTAIYESLSGTDVGLTEIEFFKKK